MHCPANETETFVKQIRSTAGERAFITAYPNQGFFVPPEWKVEKEYSAVEYAELAESWHKAGANAVGGCCGIGPELIQAVADYAADVNAAVEEAEVKLA